MLVIEGDYPVVDLGVILHHPVGVLYVSTVPVVVTSDTLRPDIHWLPTSDTAPSGDKMPALVGARPKTRPPLPAGDALGRPHPVYLLHPLAARNGLREAVHPGLHKLDADWLIRFQLPAPGLGGCVHILYAVRHGLTYYFLSLQKSLHGANPRRGVEAIQLYLILKPLEIKKELIPVLELVGGGGEHFRPVPHCDMVFLPGFKPGNRLETEDIHVFRAVDIRQPQGLHSTVAVFRRISPHMPANPPCLRFIGEIFSRPLLHPEVLVKVLREFHTTTRLEGDWLRVVLLGILA